MAEENDTPQFKYKVGDTVTIQVEILRIDEEDNNLPYLARPINGDKEYDVAWFTKKAIEG